MLEEAKIQLNAAFGCATWPIEAALEYFPSKKRLAEAFAACVKDPDNFIGASYRDNFGIPTGCER